MIQYDLFPIYFLFFRNRNNSLLIVINTVKHKCECSCFSFVSICQPISKLDKSCRNEHVQFIKVLWCCQTFSNSQVIIPPRQTGSHMKKGVWTIFCDSVLKSILFKLSRSCSTFSPFPTSLRGMYHSKFEHFERKLCEAGIGLKVEHDLDSLNRMDFRKL